MQLPETRQGWQELADSVAIRNRLFIGARRAELAALETLDMGKPIADASGVDIPLVVRTLAWYAESIDKLYGETAPTAGRSTRR